MSKYTKALEKIQEERNAAESQRKSAAPFNDPESGPESVISEMAENAERVGMDDTASFERGIAVVKNTTPDNRIVMLRFPESMLAEQYRMFRTSLKTQLSDEKARVILVSSSMHSEGKTVTAANLAVALAENGESKVVVVDADLRRGNLAEYMGFGKKRRGLTELLSEELSAKQVMCRNSLRNLVIVPRGEVTKKSYELISSAKFQYLVTELRHHFDYVIIDSPPIMSVADAGVLGRVVDGVLFVIQVGRTPKSVIAHSQVLFKQSGAKMLGYVLTNVEYQSSEYKYYNYYDEYTPDGVGRAKMQFKRAGFNFKDLEEKFNQWWEKKVLKRITPPVQTSDESEAERLGELSALNLGGIDDVSAEPEETGDTGEASS